VNNPAIGINNQLKQGIQNAKLSSPNTSITPEGPPIEAQLRQGRSATEVGQISSPSTSDSTAYMPSMVPVPIPRNAHKSLKRTNLRSSFNEEMNELNDEIHRSYEDGDGATERINGGSGVISASGRRQSGTQDNGKDHFSSPSGVRVKHQVHEQTLKVNTDHDSVSTISTTSVMHNAHNESTAGGEKVETGKDKSRTSDDRRIGERISDVYEVNERESESDWVAAFDQRRQKAYWYHKKTRQSTWVNPTSKK
jgi:hypothetical protein